MRSIGLILYPRISPMSLAVASVFEMANWNLGYPEYQLTLVSEHGGPVATSLGYAIQTVSFKSRSFDTVLVGSEYKVPDATPRLLNYLRSAYQRQNSHCCNLHGILDPRPSGTARWPEGFYPLGSCKALAAALPKRCRRCRSYLYERWPYLVIGWNECWVRSCTRLGGGRSGPGDGWRGREKDGRLSSESRWAIAALDVVGSGCNLGSRAICPFIRKTKLKQASIRR